MNKIFITAVLLFASLFTFSQATEGWVKYQNNQQLAAVLELPYTADVVNAALNDHLSKKGRSRGTDLKGFTTYRNTQPLQNDSVNADMYFKTERKSRQEKGTTIVSLLINKPGSGVVVDSMHHMNMEQAKNYLNELVPAIEAYNLELQIKTQNVSLTNAEARLKSLINDGKDLQSKKEGIEKKIENNMAEQQKQMTEIENQKQKLAGSVNQRKG